METVFFFKNMTQSEEKQLQDYFSTKLPAIEKIIKHFPEDGLLLQVKGEKFQKHSAYNVELIMQLPSKTLTSREASHLITKAIDLAKDRLMIQLKKLTKVVDRNHRSLKIKNKLKLRIASPA